MKSRDERANEHAATGGDRAAYIHGCEMMATGQPMFRNMRAYPEAGEQRTSFLKGFLDEDAAMESAIIKCGGPSEDI